MGTKLILVEGLPGSGKSTIAKKIAEYYERNNKIVNLFNEGQAHPADLAWQAFIPKQSYDSLILKYSELENEIRKNTKIEKDNAIVTYTLIKTDNNEFYKEFESYEMYDNRVDFDVFKNLLFTRWKSFGNSAMAKDELTIFECAFLQNNMNQLINFQLMDKKDIQKHLNDLLLFVENLSPVLIYLSQSNVEAGIERVAKERGDWINGVIRFFENTPYCKSHNMMKGFDSVIECFEHRKQMELELIHSFPIKTIVIENNCFDWEKVWADIELFLQEL